MEKIQSKQEHFLEKTHIVVEIEYRDPEAELKKNSYQKGSMITFPLELTEVESDYIFSNKEYLYPREVLKIQQVVEEFCDQMEYDGSMMYDEYPDKVLVERAAGQICSHEKCRGNKGIDNRWMRALAQVLLCSEMSYRRERRHHHKKNLRR